MALRFDTTARHADYSNPSSLNTLDPVTYLGLFKTPSSWSTGPSGLFAKFISGSGRICNVQITGNVLFFTGRATNFDETITSAKLPTNAWVFFAATYDAAATPRYHFYWATWPNVVTEASQGTPVTGSGAVQSDGSHAQIVGARTSTLQSSRSDWAWVGIIAEVLTLAQVRRGQHRLEYFLNHDCRVFAHYYNATGVDWSGNRNNGTINGSPSVVPHAPVGMNILETPYIPTVATPSRIIKKRKIAIREAHPSWLIW